MNITLTSKLVALAATSVLSVALSSAQVLVTFSDPSPGLSEPLFTLAGGVTLNGGWNFGGLTLETTGLGLPASTPNVHFLMSTLTLAGGVSGPGDVTFFTGASIGSGNLLRFDFLAAALDSSQTLVSDSASGGLVFQTWNGSTWVTPPLIGQNFSFNPTPTSTTPTAWTSSMAASASPVPEPCTMTLLGGAGLAYMRRRRAARTV